jgi:hypothetical protein
MAISSQKYVDITSGVAAAAAVRERDLILRLFTSSQYIGGGQVLEYAKSDLAAIAARFNGTSSAEYQMAAQYFAYVSPRMTSPQRISFAGWKPENADARVFGSTTYKAVSSLAQITSGQMALRIEGAPEVLISGVDLSTATTLADAAATVQAAVIAAGVTGALVNVNGSRFVLQVPQYTAVSVTAVVSGTNDLATALGLTEATGAFNVAGTEAMQPVEAITAADESSNNYGGFAFVQSLTVDEHAAVAAWNSTQNLKYQYYVPATKADYVTLQAALASYAGVGITISPFGGQYHQLIPASILAATRYDQRASVQNYMYRQQAGIFSSVHSTSESDALDALRVNYYGDTSSAGQQISFYQRGLLQGTGTAPTDMNVYANEQWFKDAAGAALLGLQLSLGRIPANTEGVGSISLVLQGVIDRALFNGTISTEKALTPAQRIYITQATGVETAWSAVQSQGYYLSVRIEPYVATGGNTEYKAIYEIFYSKDDAIRKIEGTHSLI